MRARIRGRVHRVVDRRVRRQVAPEVKRQVAALSRRLSDSQQAAVDRVRSAADERFRAVNAEVADLSELVRRPSDVTFTLATILGTARRYDRTLNADRFRRTAQEISKLSGVKDPEWPMRLAYRSLLDHEARGLGRVAGSTYNIVGKITLSALLAPPPGPVLEIGTLFGLFSPAVLKQFRQRGERRHLTVIDPLAGTQLQAGFSGAVDPTGTPVTAETVRYNFDVCGLGSDDVRLVEGLSTDDAVRATAGDRQYAVVIVDGDHSADGVSADLRWVETITAPGGLVVVDDFGDPRWAGVERATREYLAGGGRLQLLGTAATSAYLRMPAAG